MPPAIHHPGGHTHTSVYRPGLPALVQCINTPFITRSGCVSAAFATAELHISPDNGRKQRGLELTGERAKFIACASICIKDSRHRRLWLMELAKLAAEMWRVLHFSPRLYQLAKRWNSRNMRRYHIFGRPELGVWWNLISRQPLERENVLHQLWCDWQLYFWPVNGLGASFAGTGRHHRAGCAHHIKYLPYLGNLSRCVYIFQPIDFAGHFCLGLYYDW